MQKKTPNNAIPLHLNGEMIFKKGKCSMKFVLIALLILLTVFFVCVAIVTFSVFALGSIFSNKEDADYIAHMAQKQNLATGEP